jgi:ribosome recycling factor
VNGMTEPTSDQSDDSSVRETLRSFADQVKQDIQSLGIGEDVKQQLNEKLDQRLDEAGSRLG